MLNRALDWGNGITGIPVVAVGATAQAQPPSGKGFRVQKPEERGKVCRSG
jgi:hypothetical protein